VLLREEVKGKSFSLFTFPAFGFDSAQPRLLSSPVAELVEASLFQLLASNPLSQRFSLPLLLSLSKHLSFTYYLLPINAN
jgi:hypothetical protein